MKIHRFVKDNKHRLFFKRAEIIQRIVKFLWCYVSNFSGLIQLVILKLNYKNLARINFKSYIKNYCMITGRSRSIYRQFKVSRIELRKLGSKGLLFGLKKASW